VYDAVERECIVEDGSFVEKAVAVVDRIYDFCPSIVTWYFLDLE
jgi:hypothetical protein